MPASLGVRGLDASKYRKIKDVYNLPGGKTAVKSLKTVKQIVK